MIAWLLAVALATEVVVADKTVGDPVQGAVVRWGSEEAVTGPKGRVDLDLQGATEIQVLAEGFNDAVIAIEGDPDKVKVWLVPGKGTLEIVVEGLKPTPHATRHIVDAEQALETPGNYEDAVRLVQALPGVAIQREYAPGGGDLVVRGAAPAESRYYLDGIEIPYLYHFNQYASVFPASQLDSLELFPSAFGAAYGDAVGGIVEARSPLEPPKTVHGSVSTSFVMGGGDIKAPVGKDWWVSAAGRRSYLDLAGESSTQYPEWPRFWDFGLRAEKGDEDRGIGFFAWGAGDGWVRTAGELDVLDPVEAQDSALLDFKKGFRVAGARHHWGSDDASGRTVLALVDYDEAGELTGNGRQDLQKTRLVSRTDASWTGDGWALDAGWLAQGEQASLSVNPHPEGLLVGEELPWLARGEAVDDGFLRGQASAYTTGHVVTGPMRWMPGVRLATDSVGPAFLVEPRLATRLSLGDQTAIKAGGGRYHQRPESEELMANPRLPTTGAWQASAGLEQTIANRLEIGLELWTKFLDDPLIRPVDGPPRAADTGRGMGAELVTRYRLREKFFLWGWLAVSRATLMEGNRQQFADGDQPFQGGAVASWDIKRWNLGLRYRYGSGLPWTPITGSVYDAGRDAWLPIPGEDNSARFPAYQKLDVRTAYTAQFNGWDLVVSLELWFVPRTSAQLYPVWSYDYGEQGFVTGPTVFPLMSARARF